MDQDQGGSRQLQGPANHFALIDGGVIHGSVRRYLILKQDIPPIQKTGPKLLARLVSKRRPHIGHERGPGRDDRAAAGFGARKTDRELTHQRQLGPEGRPGAGRMDQFAGRRAGDTAETPEPFEQGSGEPRRILLRGDPLQDQGQQGLIVQRRMDEGRRRGAAPAWFGAGARIMVGIGVGLMAVSSAPSRSTAAPPSFPSPGASLFFPTRACRQARAPSRKCGLRPWI